jgi:hypothetical protein
MSPSAQTTPEMRRRPAMTTVNFSGFSCRLLDQGHETSSVSVYLGHNIQPGALYGVVARSVQKSPGGIDNAQGQLAIIVAITAISVSRVDGAIVHALRGLVGLHASRGSDLLSTSMQSAHLPVGTIFPW